MAADMLERKFGLNVASVDITVVGFVVGNSVTAYTVGIDTVPSALRIVSDSNTGMVISCHTDVDPGWLGPVGRVPILAAPGNPPHHPCIDLLQNPSLDLLLAVDSATSVSYRQNMAKYS